MRKAKFCLLSSLFLICALRFGIANAESLETYANNLGMKFVRVPARTFVMGENPPLSEGKDDERPAHEVAISETFYIGIHEVAQEQWEKVMGDNPSRHKGKDNPVDSVSWNDAREFISRLNKMDSGRLYRLPTEAEWEYAARAGSKTRYFFGNDASALADHAWITENAGGVTHPVGQKKPNAWGIFDTSGNVREWTQDLYDDKYYSESPSRDPKGPSQGYGKAYRGGSKDGAAFPTRSSYRWRETPIPGIKILASALLWKRNERKEFRRERY